MLKLKKNLSLLLSLTLLAPCTKAFNSNAEYEECIALDSLYVTDDMIFSEKDSNAVDLISIAKAQGGDTDRFSFSNYDPEKKISSEIKAKIDALEIDESIKNGHLAGINGGVSYGISVLEILTHNGVISSSDIQEGAENLINVEYVDRIKDIIYYYNIMQSLSPQYYTMNEYYCSHDDEEICADLIKYGENAMKKGKYFLICTKLGTNGHSMVGIGIADGSYKFNDKTYDKCILTLDSNYVESDNKSKSAGFSENACIYLNSKTNEYYFPAYKCGSGDKSVSVTYVSCDMDLLNYKGLINPSNGNNSDYDNTKIIQIANGRDCEYDVEITNNGQTQTYHSYPYATENGISKYSRKSFTGESDMFRYFRKLDSVTIDIPNCSDVKKRGFDAYLMSPNNFVSSIVISNDFDKNSNDNNDKCAIKLECEKASFENKNDVSNMFGINLRFVEKLNMPYTGIHSTFNVNDSGMYSISVKDEGFLIKADHMTSMLIDLTKDELKAADPKTVLTTTLTTGNDVMIKYDVEKDNIYFTIGKNFDKAVQKGDTNCDGIIDASDASIVLAGYASEQVGKTNYANPLISDINNDGKVDASDASFILKKYAELSTT